MTFQEEIEFLTDKINLLAKSYMDISLAYYKAIEHLTVIKKHHCECCELNKGGDCNCKSALAKDALNDLDN
jgi:hypothetical protein